MLGPALSLLLAQLHERAGSPTKPPSLTRYEQLLYSELRDLFDHSAVITPGMETSSLMKSLEDIKAQRKMATPPFELQARGLNEYLHTIIRPDDEDEERPRLQINCGRDDCPNKQ